MIRHIAMFRFSPESTDDQRQAAVDGLRALPELVPSIRGFEVGLTLGFVDEGADLAVVALFEDEAGWRAYIDHPEHRRVADTLIAPIRIERSTIQLAHPGDTTDPER